MIAGGLDPNKIEQIMRQMGIKSRKIESKRVVIETEEGNYVISQPEVIEIDMRGQKSFQISGVVSFEESLKDEDVRVVMEQAGCSEEQAREALKKTKGDMAEAILLLKEKE
ncbi:MAG: nascent polypeptide-associated complex protein [Candidatus Bilamarchaeaceae archaeon]